MGVSGANVSSETRTSELLLRDVICMHWIVRGGPTCFRICKIRNFVQLQRIVSVGRYMTWGAVIGGRMHRTPYKKSGGVERTPSLHSVVRTGQLRNGPPAVVTLNRDWVPRRSAGHELVSSDL
jgi:hypothetical protein